MESTETQKTPQQSLEEENASLKNIIFELCALMYDYHDGDILTAIQFLHEFTNTNKEIKESVNAFEIYKIQAMIMQGNKLTSPGFYS
jgi:hypothetical protein